MLLVADERHPQTLRQNGGVDIFRLLHQRHAYLAFARALGFQRPAGRALELRAIDLQGREDHERDGNRCATVCATACPGTSY